MNIVICLFEFYIFYLSNIFFYLPHINIGYHISVYFLFHLIHFLYILYISNIF